MMMEVEGRRGEERRGGSTEEQLGREDNSHQWQLYAGIPCSHLANGTDGQITALFCVLYRYIYLDPMTEHIISGKHHLPSCILSPNFSFPPTSLINSSLSPFALLAFFYFSHLYSLLSPFLPFLNLNPATETGKCCKLPSRNAIPADNDS